MSFFESPRFMDSISYGATGGPAFSTDIVVVSSGYERRNQNWSEARAEYDVAHGLKSESDVRTLIAFFRACSGRAHGFRFKDWTDFQVTVADGIVGSTGVGDGTPGPMQLHKVYTSGSLVLRPIRKPTVSPPPAIYRGALLQTVTTDYTIDSTTGLVTWAYDASSSASGITVGATTQVVFPVNPGNLGMGQKLYLSGFTGGDATLVNNLAHTISWVSGTGPYTFTLATDTAGKTITVGSGVGRKYPQVTESLTWSGEFDVPVRFDTDTMKLSMSSFASVDWDQILLKEIRL